MNKEKEKGTEEDEDMGDYKIQSLLSEGTHELTLERIDNIESRWEDPDTGEVKTAKKWDFVFSAEEDGVSHEVSRRTSRTLSSLSISGQIAESLLGRPIENGEHLTKGMLIGNKCLGKIRHKTVKNDKGEAAGTFAYIENTMPLKKS